MYGGELIYLVAIEALCSPDKLVDDPGSIKVPHKVTHGIRKTLHAARAHTNRQLE